MKLKIADTKVTITNLDGGSNHWVFDIGNSSYRLDAQEDNCWKLSILVSPAEFESLHYFKRVNNFKALIKGVELALQHAGAMA